MFLGIKTYPVSLVWVLASLFSTKVTVAQEGTQEIEHNGLRLGYGELEARLLACRKDPTWLTVDYEDCQRLMGWKPRKELWSKDLHDFSKMLDGKDSSVEECLKEAFENAKNDYEWARCEVNSTNKECLVKPTKIRGHYFRGEDQDESDELVVLSDAFTEQEAFGVEALEKCVREIFEHDKRFYEAREFGDDETAASHGMYNEDGGNYCTFLNGLIQIYLPGVAAATFRVIKQAYDESQWADRRSFPSPDTLGVHSAEFLQYRTNGQLSLHADDDSVFTISVSLSSFDAYEGGYFRLLTAEALFKVPRRSAIVFFGESLHGVTEIQRGERKVFVVELWDEDDAPIGSTRPSMDNFDLQRDTQRRYAQRDLNDKIVI